MFSEHVQSRADRREATRDKVLASAERLFRAEGFAGTTIRQIAADAGVSVGSVMAVGDKDTLLVAIFDVWIAAVHRDRKDPRARGDQRPLTPDAAETAVLDVFKPFLAYFAADQDLSRAYASIIVRGVQSRVFQDLASDLSAELTAVFSRARLPDSDAARAARVVHLSYLGLLMIAANSGFDEQSALDQLRDVVRFIMKQKGSQA